MGAFMISFSPVFVSLVNVSPTTSGFYRVFFGGVALTTFIFLSGRRLSFNKSIWIALVFSAVFFTADLWFWHRSILYVGPGLSTLLANFQVFFMLLASIMLFKQQPTKMQIIAIPVALLGLLAIVGIDWNQLHSDYRLGVIFGLLTAVSYTGYMLFMRQAQIDSKHVLPVREIAIMSLLVALSLGVIAQMEGESLAINSLQDLSLLLAYGLFSHATGLILIASALAKVTTAEVGIVLLLQPSLSFIWDVLLFNRSFTLVEFIGVSMVLVAIYMSSKRTE
ncbi:MAG: DMT family transporter [Woeseiaceae bacterium]|jgi:drug/metabolite transporter (DMT)-like permease|nr:DMT family transporter [Woeseiaceae bacterium]MDG1865056.1 DMT family transporter [Woeseiaceae bacterium]